MKARYKEALRMQEETVGQKAAKIMFAAESEAQAEQVAQSIVALVGFMMLHQWGWSVTTAKRRLQEVCAQMAITDVLGVPIHDFDYRKFTRERIGFDVEKEVKLNVKVKYI